VNVTVSTSTAKTWPATNSATSRRAKRKEKDDEQSIRGELNFSKEKKKGTQLESLGSVVVSGCPPLASRICSRVSLNSRPRIEVTAGAAGAGAEVVATAAAAAFVPPSRSALSSAAFCARCRLSASICALTAARAFLSFSFSIRMRRYVTTARTAGSE
jgi:hypothetical protein